MMSMEWRDFLQNAGAFFDNGRVDHFGNPAREALAISTGEALTDLSHRALIAVRGDDAEKFLQGQLTGDVHAVTADRSRLSAHCNPKGRALACFRIFRRDDTLYLVLPEALLQTTLDRLRKYVLMSKATLEPETGLMQIGYAGTEAVYPLRGIIHPLPDADNGVSRAGDATVIRIPGPHPRFEIFGPEAALKSLWSQLAVRAIRVGSGRWEWLDILAGLPSLYPETVDAFVPQMINLDLLGGISFKKGCYTGQEIVARTHYLGKLKRRMYRLHCLTDNPPAPGTAIYNTGHRSDEGVGTVVMSQATPEGGITLLAVLQMDAAAHGELHMGQFDGPVCTVQELPYPLETTSD